MKTFYWFLFALSFSSCHLPSADSKYSDATKNTYKLKLNPAIGSFYHYDVVSTTEIDVEADDNKVKSTNRSFAGMTYAINKDTNGNYLFGIKYDKLQINAKNGDNETELDADNGRLSSNPTERMLGLLKDANLTAVVTPAGNVKEIKGYQDLSMQLLSMLDPNDVSARQAAQSKLDKQIRGEMIKKTMNQLLKIFPDSAVHVGEKWKIDYKMEGELTADIMSSFKLTNINKEVGFVTSTSEIVCDNAPIILSGNNVIANLIGSQNAAYQLETKTGMLISSESESEIKGTLQISGKEIPISIKIKITMEGKKIN